MTLLSDLLQLFEPEKFLYAKFDDNIYPITDINPIGTSYTDFKFTYSEDITSEPLMTDEVLVEILIYIGGRISSNVSVSLMDKKLTHVISGPTIMILNYV